MNVLKELNGNALTDTQKIFLITGEMCDVIV